MVRHRDEHMAEVRPLTRRVRSAAPTVRNGMAAPPPHIEIDSGLLDDVRLLLLAEELADESLALGIVCRLWLWSAVHIPSGILRVQPSGTPGDDDSLNMIEACVIKRAVAWDGPAHSICNALIKCAFLTPLPGGGFRVTDWGTP